MIDKTFLNPGIYHNKPSSFTSDIESCACFIRLNDKYLFLQKAIGKWSENLWGIPCGKIEKNEDIYFAMQRELKEEIGCKIELDRLEHLGTLFIVQKEGLHNTHNVFLCNINANISIKLSNEHVDYKWLSNSDFFAYSFIPYQKEVLEHFFT
jgi:8-oxo-dGTP diphosphatase